MIDETFVCKALLRKASRVLVEEVLEEDETVTVDSNGRAEREEPAVEDSPGRTEEEEPAAEDSITRAEVADRAGESGGSIESSSDSVECRISRDGVRDVIKRVVALKEEEREEPGVKR